LGDEVVVKHYLVSPFVFAQVVLVLDDEIVVTCCYVNPFVLMKVVFLFTIVGTLKEC
jgi:hypothetical protein